MFDLGIEIGNTEEMMGLVGLRGKPLFKGITELKGLALQRGVQGVVHFS